MVFPTNPDYVIAVVLAMYDRKVRHYQDVWSHVEHTVKYLPLEKSDRPTTLYLSQLFLDRLETYLRGAGHPRHRDIIDGNLIPLPIVERDQHNTVLRSQLLLQALGSSVFMPLLAQWRIQVCVWAHTGC